MMKNLLKPPFKAIMPIFTALGSVSVFLLSCSISLPDQIFLSNLFSLLLLIRKIAARILPPYDSIGYSSSSCL